MLCYNLLMKQLQFHDQTWEYVKDRTLERGQVFRSADGMQYMRTGEPERIAEEVAFARQVQANGFPVPEVQEDGLLPDSDLAYYIEKSLGGQTFGIQFMDEYALDGKVSDTTFDHYIAIVVHFLQAQLDSRNRHAGPSELRQGVNVQNVLEENPDIDADRMEQAVQRAESRLSQLPLVLSHGDFGPFNILDNGVIDFEHKFIAPVGFDVLTSPFSGRFWNFTQNGNYKLVFDFSEEQIARYMAAIDRAAAEHGVDNLSQYTDDTVFLKAVWSLSFEKTAATLYGLGPEKWHWRRDTVKYCLDRYLDGKPIDTATFRHS